jgi:hypothetical protein
MIFQARIAVSSGIFVFLFSSICFSQDAPMQDNLAEFMRAKLTHSQKILEGLTTSDFAMIEKSSQELSLLSRTAQWQVIQSADYARHSSDFGRAADQLTEAARNKNLDGATLAYVKVTMKCIECHKFVDKVGEAKFENFDDEKFSALLKD